MAESEAAPDPEEEAPKRGMGKLGWILTGVLALGLGGGGFYATFSGLVGGHAEDAEMEAEIAVASDTPQFLELDPLTISVGGAGSVRQLRFRAFLEVEDQKETVRALQPRILDIFATYLRATSLERLEDPTALLHLRAQLLRRIQLLAGQDAVKDLLIIDFVIA